MVFLFKDKLNLEYSVFELINKKKQAKKIGNLMLGGDS